MLKRFATPLAAAAALALAGGAQAAPFGILFDGVDVNRYDYDSTNGFSNRTVIQLAPASPPFEGGQDGQDNHLDCPTATRCVVYTGLGSGDDFYSMDLDWNTGFSNITLESGWSRPSAFEDSDNNTSDDADDNHLAFLDSDTAVLFNGVGVYTYDFDFGSGFSNETQIQGVPSGFETNSTGGGDNQLAFLDADTAVYFRGDDVLEYDFDLVNGFTNGVVIQDAGALASGDGSKGFETGSDAQDNMLAIVPEPGTMLLLGSGLAGLGVLGRRRR